MITIIAGSREDVTYEMLLEAVKLCPWEITSVVCGGARGADYLGKVWGKSFNLPVYEYLADWTKGKGAGYARNTIMAENAEALLAIHKNQSRGTEHMINIAKAKNLHVYVYNL